MRRVSVLWALRVFAASVLLPALACAQTQVNLPSAGKNVAAAQETNAPKTNSNSPPDYVGAEVCKTCHEDIYNGWEKTPHWKTTLDTTCGPSHQGCESCHGPNGEGEPVSGVPYLGGQYSHYISVQIQMFRQGYRKSQQMIVPAHNLSEQDIIALADYFEQALRPPVK